jgi:hypothetical protein
MTGLWSRFRNLPLWLQIAVWVLAWPVPLGLWATARPQGRRRGPVVVAAASAMVWIAIPLSSSASPDKGTRLVAGGQVAPAPDTSSTPGSSAAPSGPAVDSPTGTDAPSSTTTGPLSTTTGSAAPAPTVKQKPPGSTASTTRPAQPSPGDPTAVLVGLRVAPEGARTGYQRELFKHWVDADRDTCDTREEVLIAESLSTAQVDPYGCKVLEGDWFSSYDGLTFTDPSELDIDHMVPLAEAWDSGASAWDAGRRQSFANDLDHSEALRAVSASSNRSKGDLDPGQWKPTRDAAWCEYANDWVTVKKVWDLTADENEVDDLRVMLRTCREPAPQSGSPSGVQEGATAESPTAAAASVIRRS